MISEWLNNCLHHPICGYPSNHSLPTRVIDVGPSDGSQEPFLSNTNGKKGAWIALSHCWGESRPLCTTIATEKIRKRKITPLPPTFQDAVAITRALGIRFLWIDALCILQDSQQDWAAESSQMGRTYEEAFLTLQLDAVDSSVSLLAPRETEDVWLKVPSTMQSQGWKGFLYLGTEATNVTRSFVNHRAWTMQELLLSPRTLALTADGFIWSCRCLFAVERMPNPHEDWVFTAPQWRTKMDFWIMDEMTSHIMQLGSLSLPRNYHLLVCEYMSRNISHETDRLVAWSGIAREIAQRTSWTYIAGLWVEDIHRALLWSYEGYGQGFSSYVAPTWSWAAQEFDDIGEDDVSLDSLPKVYGSVFRMILKEQDEKFDCSIINIEVDLVTDDPYGQVRSGELSIKGQWRQADLCTQRMPYFVIGRSPRYLYSDDGESTYFHAWNNEEFMQAKDVTIICDFDILLEGEVGKEGMEGTDAQKRLARNWSELSFLQISKWKCDENPSGTIWALILHAEDDSSTSFKRVGVAQIADDVASGWERRLVKIV